MLNINDHDRVRTLAFNRPAAMKAFNESLYHATSSALRNAADDGEVAVVILTGTGRAFSAGTDLQEMQDREPTIPFTEGARGFARLMQDTHRLSETIAVRRQRHHQALRALGNRLVGILHGCLRHQTPYDEHTAWAHRTPAAA